MCDIQTATVVLRGRKMDLDREMVQCVAIIGGVAIGITALVVDGEAGYAVAMGLTNLATAVVAYVFGSSKGGDGSAEEVQVNDSSA